MIASSHGNCKTSCLTFPIQDRCLLPLVTALLLILSLRFSSIGTIADLRCWWCDHSHPKVRKLGWSWSCFIPRELLSIHGPGIVQFNSLENYCTPGSPPTRGFSNSTVVHSKVFSFIWPTDDIRLYLAWYTPGQVTLLIVPWNRNSSFLSKLGTNIRQDFGTHQAPTGLVHSCTELVVWGFDQPLDLPLFIHLRFGFFSHWLYHESCSYLLQTRFHWSLETHTLETRVSRPNYYQIVGPQPDAWPIHSL